MVFQSKDEGLLYSTRNLHLQNGIRKSRRICYRSYLHD